MPAIGAAVSGIAGFLASGSIFAKLAVSVLISIGTTLIRKALSKNDAPKDTTPEPTGVTGSIRLGGDGPLSFIVGYYATDGSLEYTNTWGDPNKAPNAYLVQVISLSDLPVDELVDVFVNNEKVTLLTGQGGSMGFPVSQYRKNGVDYMWVRLRDGKQTTADAYLVSKFGDHPDYPWDSACVGVGVAYAVVTMRVNRDLYKNIPSFRFAVNGALLYDLRKDSTNGGSGSHRWTNPNTWEFTSNPVVIIYNIMRGVYYDGTWIYGMQNLPAARLPSASWIAAANVCDQAVPLSAGGTERQYRCGAEIFVDRPGLDTVESLLKTCSGRVAEIGGTYKITVGAPTAPVYSFTDEDIIRTEVSDFDPFPGLEETFNAIHISYPEPREAWQNKDAPPRYISAYEVQDDNRRLIANVSMPFVPYRTQIQRLGASLLQSSRRFRRHIVSLPPDAYMIEPVDVVEWTSTHQGYDQKDFFVLAIEGSPGYIQTLVLLEVDPSDYDWSTDFELPDSVGYLTPIRPAPQPVADWTVEPDIIVGDGGTRGPGLKITWDPSLVDDDVRAVAWYVVLTETQDEVTRGMVESVSRGAVRISQNLRSTTYYDVAIQYIPYTGRVTLLSEYRTVRTPDVKLNDVEVLLSALAAETRLYFKERYKEFENEVLNLRILAADIAARNTQDVVDSQYFRKETGRLSAEILEERTIRISENEAFAQELDLVTARLTTAEGQLTAQASTIIAQQASITTLNGQVSAQSAALILVDAKANDATANGLLKWEAVASPAGTLARFSLVGKATALGVTRTGGMFFDVSPSSADIKFDVTRFVIMDSANNKALPFTFQGGAAILAGARIGDLTFSTISSANGKLQMAGYGNNAYIAIFT